MQVLVSAKHQMVAVPVTAQLENLFPHAKRPSAELLAMPHTFDVTKMLRNLGYEVPAPVLSQYDWCGGKPFEVQKKTVAVLTTEKRAYVLSGFGTGKTKCALWAFDALRGQGRAQRMLVIAPLSTLSFVWAREVLQTTPHLKVAILHGTREQRLERLADMDVDIYVINHDGVSIIASHLPARHDINVLTIDELATYRNWNKRTKTMKALAFRFEWAWGMTGSPTPNAPTDVWGQAQILTPERVNSRWTHYRDELMIKIGNGFKYAPKKDATEQAFKALQPSVRFTLDEVVELPDMVERTVQVGMGPKQSKAYEDLRKHTRALVAAHEITAANAGVVLMKLLQVSSGWVYTSDKRIVELDGGLRLQALEDLIASTDRKVIVFAPFKHTLHGIHKHLAGAGYDVAPYIDGDVLQTERNRIFSRFQNTPSYKVLPAHPGTMAHGLTLTAADTIIWFAPISSNETFEQANARIRRVGQRHRQQILMLEATPVEKRVYQILQNKQDLQDKLLEMFEGQ
jgi:SNF2 family DNA or RNA helicase